MEDNLPSSLKKIADVISLKDTLKLVHAYGGLRIFVPRKLHVQHKLVILLGLEQAQRLSHHFGGKTLTVARAVQLSRHARNLEILRRYDAGANIPQLARENELTERRIYEILKKPLI